jgi:hypothetical protein
MKKHAVVAIALVVLGLVIVVPSGLCAGVLGGFDVLSDVMAGRTIDKDSWLMMQLSLMFAVPLMVGGGLLIWFGIHLLRK